jgi:hypothetical protein
MYVALRPLKTDAEGRIVEARAWMVLCAKPIGKDQSAADYKPDPLPGLVLEVGNCRADGQVLDADSVAMPAFELLRIGSTAQWRLPMDRALADRGRAYYDDLPSGSTPAKVSGP